jgi:sulfide:quinone oxidoreductase
MNIAKLTSKYFATGQITRDDLGFIADQGFKSIVNNRPDHESADQPKSDELGAAAADLGIQYVYLPVVAGRITDKNVDDFKLACDNLEGPILLFCRSGARSTMLWQLSVDS